MAGQEQQSGTYGGATAASAADGTAAGEGGTAARASQPPMADGFGTLGNGQATAEAVAEPRTAEHPPQVPVFSGDSFSSEAFFASGHSTTAEAGNPFLVGPHGLEQDGGSAGDGGRG